MTGFLESVLWSGLDKGSFLWSIGLELKGDLMAFAVVGTLAVMTAF